MYAEACSVLNIVTDFICCFTVNRVGGGEIEGRENCDMYTNLFSARNIIEQKTSLIADKNIITIQCTVLHFLNQALSIFVIPFSGQSQCFL